MSAALREPSRLLHQMAGVAVSTGWMAGIRGKTAALVTGSGFLQRSGNC